jgi:general secretion pathway protein G
MQSRKQSGFTLVEILIVVIILGILAAIVIPQFTNAGESAKGSSLVSQLQTLRSQLELYQIQHNGSYPTTWNQLTSNTTQDGTVGSGEFGPYLQQPSRNPFSSAAPTPTGNIGASDGWNYNATTGVVKAEITLDQAKTAGLVPESTADLSSHPDFVAPGG